MQEGEQGSTDLAPLLRQMGNVLRSRGVEWEDRWFVSDPTPEEPAPVETTRELPKHPCGSTGSEQTWMFTFNQGGSRTVPLDHNAQKLLCVM